MRRRVRLLLSVSAVVLVLAGVAVIGLLVLRHKTADPAWTDCGTGNREVRGIAVSPVGRIFVAANEAGRGDVLFSDDRCASFTPVGLSTQAAWSVSWLPRAQALCAGTREGLRCLVGGALLDSIPSSEVYFALETREGVIAGGWPILWFGKMDLSQFAPTLQLTRAATDAVSTDWATLVAGPDLLASVDGGHSFTPLTGAGFAPRALAAYGARVYAAGGSFGGFVMRSDDGGQTWAPLESPGSRPEALLVLPGRPDAVVLATHGDVRPGDAYLSTDGGASWRALGCPGAEIHALAVDGDSLYCGATSPGGARGMWRMSLSALGLVAAPNAI